MSAPPDLVSKQASKERDSRLNEPIAPSRIGRYEIHQELGRGTMGVVYEAEDPALGRRVAVKTIQVPLAASQGERAEYEKRFLAEARIAARLSHSGIVVVHDVGRDAEHDILYIALEHLRGRTLAEVAAEGPMEWREALRIVGRLAEAVRYAHAQGVVHRDIKPANIMLVASGEPKIMDFGIAKLEAGQHTSPGQSFGTPLYMSPEQALGQPVDGRTDLFSLGSVAYLLLSGRPPFEAPNVPGILARVAYQHPKPLRDLVPGLPPDAEYVVTRAMAKNPADRYPDGRAMAEDVEDVRAGRPPRHRARWTPPAVGAGTVASVRAEALPELSLDPVEARRPRRRRRTTFRLVLVLGLVSAAYFYLHPSDWQFWRRAVAEARKARVAEEVRAWWGRIGVESPEAPAATVAPDARPSTAVASPTPGPPAEVTAASPLPVVATDPTAPPPTTLAEIVSIPEDDPDPIASHPPAPAEKKGTRAAAPPPAKPHPTGQLVIEFEHHLKHGNLQVWVDEDRVVNDDFDGRITRKILSFELRKGLVQQRLALAPGRHSVRVTVRWEDNTKTARISGVFPPGTARKLDVDVSRIGGKLTLEWK